MGQGITPIFDTEIERVKEQLAQADALRKQGFANNTGGGYQGGKVFMVGSPLGNVAQGLAGIYMGENARTRQGELEQSRNQQRQEFLAQMPSATEAVPQAGPMEDGSSMPDVERTKSPLQHAREMQQWGAKAMNIPGMEGLGGTVLTEAIKAPQRQAELLQKAQDRIYEIQTAASERRISKAEADERQAVLLKSLKQMGIDSAQLIASMRIGAAGAKDNKPDMRFVDTVDENGNPIKQVVDMNAVKPGDTFGKPTKAPKGGNPKENAAEVLKILEQVDPLIGGSTASGLGNLVDTGMGFFGKSTGGADKAAQLRSLGGILVSKMPRMEGPQSDKDVALYKEMAGRIGDPTVPTSQKRAAVETIRELNSRYSGVQYVPGGAAPEAPTSGGEFKVLSVREK